MNEGLRLSVDEMRAADAACDARSPGGHPASFLAADTLSPTGVAVAGTDSYLFIANGANQWERQFLGEAQIPPEWFEGWRQAFRTRQAEAAARGVVLCNLIVPEKQVIYPDKRWTDGLERGAERPVLRLLPRLPPDARVLYAAEALASARMAAPAYFRHDSHWTPSGCAAVAETLFKATGAQTGDGPVRFALRPERRTGDLSKHFFDPSPQEDATVLAPSGEVVFDNMQFETTGQPTGAAFGVRNPGAPDPRTVIVFGDSFAHRAGLTAALSAVFAQVNFIWSKSVVWTEAEACAADVVIWESAERFMATLPMA